MHAHLDGRRMTDREAAGALGMGNAIRYAATTGTVAIRWEGARAPTVWTVDALEVDPADACRELARRYLHIFGPATADGFARWAGISRRAAGNAFASLVGALLAVRSPHGHEWLLADDEPAVRAPATAPAPARLLPSGDSYFLLDEAERELLLPRSEQRQRLWTPAFGQARSSSKARSGEPGDERSTSCESTPGVGSRVGCAMRSRPTQAPYRFQASSDVSTWFGTPEPRL